MADSGGNHLRVLIANERRDRLELLARVVAGLGLVREAFCPVIALLSARNPSYVHEAAKRGIFAYVVDGTPEELESAIDITLQRFAVGRRALIEQAKRILMERCATSADKAFDMLRDHSQRSGRKLVEIAEALVESHLLLRGDVPESP
jgi:AmiR/NasT family two-component response regulator